MYTREEVKSIVDKVINMADADTDAVEVNLSGGERSGTRWANSSITTNLVQYDRNITVTVRIGQKAASANTRDFSDDGLREMVNEAIASARKANDNRNLRELLGPQEYIPVDAALPSLTGFGPLERARLVKDSLDMAESMGVLGAGYIPKVDRATCSANSKGLFAYHRSAETNFTLTCRMPDGSGSGWSGLMGIKDLAMIDAAELTRVAADKALKSRNAKALEPGRYTVILEPRANARMLSLMTSIFNGGGGGPRGGAGGGQAAGAARAAVADSARSAVRPDSTAAGRAGAAGATAADAGDDGDEESGPPRGGGGGGSNSFMAGKGPGDKIFSDQFSLRSDVGNPILRQSTILNDSRPAAPVTWVENGVLRNFTRGQPATVGTSMVMDGTDLTIEDMVRQTRRGLLVTALWYIRGVPSQSQPLLNTGMTRDGLFLIENGEIVAPVQNFRWNMSPLVAYNNLTLVGQSVPMGLGESYDISTSALIPAARIEEFAMTSVSPAV